MSRTPKLDILARWIYTRSGTDGLLHIVISALIAAVLTTMMHPLIAAVATIVIGVAKEFVYDLILHRRVISVKDIVCDIIGAVIVLISQI